ncbi:MAG: phage terminase large subunit [Rickettsiales bacterium]|nr:phage terminase large subunit [Pseudomonadota bacterium]MDA0965431.1 phage terminase large subunit [Pseudomonadota bacterium]MDG4542756.1 phage terminase large subunit [Rickettsiales bacterium]MDG4544796.1 phage terminase large subunit [Rickettsiales bacterium]MDG4546918.1 phage terminase large subunit [Rickettsiales bacterium]
MHVFDNEAASFVLEERLINFIEKTFHTVDPGTKFQENWHIDLIADRLEKVAEGKIKRLIINVPPRSLKSICVSVAWPAWVLGRNPSAKLMVASYSQILSLKHSMDCKLVMSSDWYKETFPYVEIAHGQNEKFKFVTTQRGFRFATSVGGTATGEGGDILIVDDPHNPMQAASDVQRKAALDWFDRTFMSRLNNKKKGVVVVVMQRLHVNDLTGHLLSKKGVRWNQLCLPAVSDRRKTYTIRNYKKSRVIFKKGEILNPKREGEREIERAKQELGSYAYAAQYLQNPVNADSGMVNIDWFKRYNVLPEGNKVVQSWDTAIKTGANNDVSASTSWIETQSGYYLADVTAKKMEYPELKRTVISLAQKWNANTILIEDKASGQSLIQDLKRETKLPIIAVNPKNDKITRFAAVTALIEAGRVWLPNSSEWLIDYETQILGFPNTPNDDMVDSTSQFLNWVRNKRNINPSLRLL